MTNADLFTETFNGLMATELWSKSEQEFLDWLNKEVEVSEDWRKTKMTAYQSWLKCCEKNNANLYLLLEEDDGESGLYKLASSEYRENDSQYGILPIYVVWWHGKNVFITTKLYLAYDKWDSLELNEDFGIQSFNKEVNNKVPTFDFAYSYGYFNGRNLSYLKLF